MAAISPNRQTEIEDLFRFNYRPLCMYALHYLQDTDLVEDVVQECFTTLLWKCEDNAIIRCIRDSQRCNTRHMWARH